ALQFSLNALAIRASVMFIAVVGSVMSLGFGKVTILLGLPEDIYAAVDCCETAQEIWLRVHQMTKGSYIGIQEKKAKLFNEWERFTSSDGESIESYYHHFLKLMNDLKRNKHFQKRLTAILSF
nr:hypothetical protein [Tanacetum cinerariifolium]